MTYFFSYFLLFGYEKNYFTKTKLECFDLVKVICSRLSIQRKKKSRKTMTMSFQAVKEKNAENRMGLNTPTKVQMREHSIQSLS